MQKQRKQIVPAHLLVGYGCRRKVTVVIGTGKAPLTKREWEATWKGEVIGTFDYQKDAINFIREKATS